MGIVVACAVELAGVVVLPAAEAAMGGTLCDVGAAEAEGACAEVAFAAREFAAGDVYAVDAAAAVLGFGGEVPGFGNGGVVVATAAECQHYRCT